VGTGISVMGSPRGHSGSGTICPTAADGLTPACLLAASTSVARVLEDERQGTLRYRVPTH
jgi:hypothetical protein